MQRIISHCQAEISSPPRWSPTRWANERRFLSPEDSAEPGKYRSDRAPYQAGIMDAVIEKPEVIIMSSAQVGKTLIGMNILGFLIDLQPCPILWIAPSLEMAEATSKDRIAPMLRDCPCFEGKVKSAQARNSGNTLLHKSFPGGHVTLAGANSPASLASRPVRVFIGDEIDRYPLSAGTEGDPVALAKKRTTTFWNRLIVLVSTPTRKGHSRIEKAWLQSDQRYFLLPCPHCGYHQHLKWENLNYSGKGTQGFDVSDIAYFCEACGCAISESNKPDMLRKGYWKAFGSGLSAGFHLNELVSPWKSWVDVALDYEAAREDPNQYRVWYNTSLGLPLEDDDRTKFDWENLLKRAEKSDYSSGQIPEGALFLTAGVDRQGDRLEVSVYGWGEGEQCWLISHEQFFGDPLEDQVWNDVEDFLKKQYRHPLGGKISVTKTMVDTSYETHDTYRQVKKRPNWVAIKGKEGDREIVPSATMVGVNYQGVKLKNGIKLYVLGVDRAKSTLLSRCKIETPGAKYLNVPADLTRFWAEGFAGSEVLLTKHRNGKPYYVWEKISNIRNEPLDCAVYAFACAILCGVHRDSYNWARLRKLLTIEATIREDKPDKVSSVESPIEPEKPVKKSVPRMQKSRSRFDY